MRWLKVFHALVSEERVKLEWPGGYRLPVILTFNFDSGEGAQTFAGGATHHFYYDARQYGARIGIWHLLDTLEKHNVRATFFICGATAEKFPEAVREICKRGHEVAGFTYTYDQVWRMTEGQEDQVIERTVSAIQEAAGRRPSGWRCPDCRISEHTLALLTRRSFAWDSDFCNDHLPYIFNVEGSRLVEVPATNSTNDMIYISSPNPRGLSETMYMIWQDEFDVLYQESETKTRMMTLISHPFLISRPAQLKALGDFLEYMTGHDGVWFARASEIAELVLRQAR